MDKKITIFPSQEPKLHKKSYSAKLNLIRYVVLYIKKGNSIKYLQIFLIILGASLLIGFVVFWWMPDYRSYILREDSLVENLSAFFYLITFLLGSLFFIKSKRTIKPLVIVSAVGILGFLDEISFGERLFALHMPRIGDLKIDAAHDFIELGYWTIRSSISSYPVFTYTLIVGSVILAAIVTIKYQHKLISTISILYRKQKQTFILVLFFISLIFAALVIDLEIVHHDALFALEELFELNASIALFFCCFSLYDQRLQKTSA